MLLLAMFAILSTYAQKSKGNPDSLKKTSTTQAKYVCEMHPEVVSDKPGKCPICGSNLVLSKKGQMKMEVMKIYTCPMHLEEQSNKPGKCPKCGMTLVEKKSKKGDSTMKM